MKRTQIVTHIMPTEIDEYSDIIDKLTEASEYLEKKDWVSIYATLNLSPDLIKWEESELKQEFFIEKFNQIKEKCSWANEVIFEIIDDNSILGTTAQKRKAIKGDYDEFIFLDCDIAFHPMTLKYLLMAGLSVESPYYFITPQTIKLWDSTWDCITHVDFLSKDYGYEKLHLPNTTYKQIVKNVSIVSMDDIDDTLKHSQFQIKHKVTNEIYRFVNFRFACGWFTLYSKPVVDLIGVPEWLGHYGPEDTYMVFMSEMYKMENWPIQQYVLDGIYVSENYLNRDVKYKNKLKMINFKDEFRKKAENILAQKINEAKDLIPTFK